MLKQTDFSDSSSAVSSKNQSGKLPIDYFFCCVILIIGVTIGFFFRHYRTDDPFITYRYARNIAEGLGFVYNPGEKVLGVTNPLYTFLMALFYKLGFDLPKVSTILSMGSWTGVCILTYLIFLDWKQRQVGMIASLLLMTQSTFLWGIGLESNFSLLLILIGFYGYFKERYYLSAFFLSMAVLNRPDSILVPFLLLAHYLWSKRKFPMGPFLFILVLTLPWFLFSKFYFGSFTPNTLSAKIAQGKGGTWFFGMGNFFPAFLHNQGLPLNPIIYNRLLLILFFSGLVYCLLYFRKPLLLFSWSLLYFISYSFLQIPGAYLWYYIPIIFGMVILSAFGIYWIPEIILSWFIGESFKTTTIRKYINKSGILLIVVITLIYHYQILSQVYDWNIRQTRFPMYRSIVEELKLVGTPNNTLACTEIGILGYYSNFRMIDPCGLVTPEVVKHLATDWWWSYRTLKPDFCVLYEYNTDLKALPEWFKNDYIPIHYFPTPKHIFNNTRVILYQRKDLKPTPSSSN